ncbi:MAG: hypothetical protein ACAI34_13105 [Verrucomicrobium sp.]|nr:hypothetical protein [Verrucomicrobium sp.]
MPMIYQTSPKTPESTHSIQRSAFFSAITSLFSRSGELLDPDNRISATAEFNHKIGPIQRGDVYEDPLTEYLDGLGAGEVDGGGTMQNKDGEIAFCDLHMLLHPSETIIPSIIQFLEQRGAPRGSKLRVFSGESIQQEIPFGIREGFGVYLDGVNLPDEVYRDCDSNFVVSELDRLLSGHGSVEAHWQGPTETALYLYGDSIAVMTTLVTDFLASYPLCRGARVVDLTPS